MMEDTLDFLLPSYQQLGARGLDLALHDVKDAELRKAMMADADLHADILKSILDMEGQRLGTKVLLGKARQHLDVIHNMPMPMLLLRLGCAGCSETLARVAISNFDAIEAAKIPRDILKTSLRFRSLSLANASDDVPSRQKLETDGCNTLVAWLKTLPKEVGNLVALRLDVLTDKIELTHLDKRKKLCEAVLTDLVAAGSSA